MNTNALLGAGSVPLIAGIIQVFKATGLPSRLAPAVALMLGLGAGVISAWQTSPAPISWAAAIILGITWGLAASGLYEGGKLAGVALWPDSNPYTQAPAKTPPPPAPAPAKPLTAVPEPAKPHPAEPSAVSAPATSPVPDPVNRER